MRCCFMDGISQANTIVTDQAKLSLLARISRRKLIYGSSISLFIMSAQKTNAQNAAKQRAKWADTEITKELGISYPIIQGPLGGGLSTSQLVASVSNAGGLGSFGAHNLTPGQITQAASDIRAKTDKPFALNLWVPPETEPQLSQDRLEQAINRFRPYYAELGIDAPPPPKQLWQNFQAQAEAVLAAKPAVFSFVFGIPPADLLSEFRRQGIYTVGTAATIEEAVALEQASVNAIAATGFEAGGMRAAFLPSRADPLTSTFALVPQAASAVKVPVIAAGGIADARALVAALALGAQAVQMGTAFLACQESAAPQVHRDKLFSPEVRDTVVTSAFNGRPARVIRNRLVEELAAQEAVLLPFPWQAWLTGSLRKAAIEQGKSGLLALQASQAAGILRHRNAAALVAELVHGVPQLTSRFA
jgi:nitronate monooxygenase